MFSMLLFHTCVAKELPSKLVRTEQGFELVKLTLVLTATHTIRCQAY